MTPEEVQSVLEANLLKLPHIESLPLDVQKKIIRDAAHRILQNVVLRIQKELPQERAEEFSCLFSETDNDTITAEHTAFLTQYVPNLEDIFLEETLAFKKGVLDAVTSGEKLKLHIQKAAKNLL